MRPLLVELNRDYRGGQHQALLLLQGLAARGHAAEIVTLGDSILASRARSAGIMVHGVSARARRVAAAIVVRGLVREGRADIVHANEPHALTAAWLARAHHHVPLVVSRRVLFPLSPNLIALGRYRAAARILAVSQCVKDAILISGLPLERITVIPVGVNIPPLPSLLDRVAARRKLAARQEGTILGNVGAFTPDKGQDLLIRAFAHVREQFPQSQLLLAGDGPERGKLRALVEHLQLDAAVQFTGFVEDVENIYKGIDLFVFPGLADALPTVLLAAMAHGLPVVGLARGGVPEVLENGKNGLLFGEPDPKSLALAIARLLSNPAEARQLGAAARETIIAGFSSDHMVERTMRVYEDLIGARMRS
jgi:glycosyltransferase involved in cell wall biosynthesis